jgi:hypothetical protein
MYLKNGEEKGPSNVVRTKSELHRMVKWFIIILKSKQSSVLQLSEQTLDIYSKTEL